MATFRKKPVEIVIDAQQYREGQPKPAGVCYGYLYHDCRVPRDGRGVKHGLAPAHVHTIHKGQTVLLEDGDWIIAEQDGIHFYPCKPDVFAATYEPVN